MTSEKVIGRKIIKFKLGDTSLKHYHFYKTKKTARRIPILDHWSEVVNGQEILLIP